MISKLLIFDNVKRYAKKRDISISKLERMSDLSKGTISKWNTVSPTADNLKRVANNLKLKVDKLLEEGEEQ